MKTIALLCCLVAMSTLPLVADQAEAELIHKLRMESNAAFRVFDTEKTLSFLTEDVLTTTGSGTLLTGKKALIDYIAAIEPSALFFIRTPQDIEVNSKRGLAWETGHWQGFNKVNEQQVVVAGKYSAMWTKASGRWLIKSQLFVTLD